MSLCFRNNCILSLLTSSGRGENLTDVSRNMLQSSFIKKSKENNLTPGGIQYRHKKCIPGHHANELQPHRMCTLTAHRPASARLKQAWIIKVSGRFKTEISHLPLQPPRPQRPCQQRFPCTCPPKRHRLEWSKARCLDQTGPRKHFIQGLFGGAQKTFSPHEGSPQ